MKERTHINRVPSPHLKNTLNLVLKEIIAILLHLLEKRLVFLVSWWFGAKALTSFSFGSGSSISIYTVIAWRYLCFSWTRFNAHFMWMIMLLSCWCMIISWLICHDFGNFNHCVLENGFRKTCFVSLPIIFNRCLSVDDFIEILRASWSFQLLEPCFYWTFHVHLQVSS